MIYRHIYWGLLKIGPNEHNLLTKAVRKKMYLLKIVTPFSYQSKEDALEDTMTYRFEVFGKKPILTGFPLHTEEEKGSGHIPTGCLLYDRIHQEDWVRYRMISLKADEKGRTGKKALKGSMPYERKWEKVFPVLGVYPLEKVAYSIIALPEVEEVMNCADPSEQGS